MLLTEFVSAVTSPCPVNSHLKEISAEVAAELPNKLTPEQYAAITSADVGDVMFSLESKIVRGQILNGEPRIDGRDQAARI